MKEINIAYMFPGFVKEEGNVCLAMNGDKYGLKFNWIPFMGDVTPDYIIATEHIYRNPDFLKQYLKFVKRGALVIYITGEALSPDMNICDYAICFDRHLQMDDRIGRKPTLYFFTYSLFDEYIGKKVTDEELRNKTKFCNFIYSHASKERDQLFYKLSEYKKVDSLGKHLNNTGIESTRYVKGWQKLSIEMRQEYKFSIAAENASLNGYTTEKLISCLEAKTIPIYWGDSTVGEELNTKAFVNCHEYESLDAVLERIKEIDQNEELFRQILNEPWQTEDQVKQTAEDVKKYEDWLAQIFIQDKEDARRITTGPMHEDYMYWFVNRYKLPFTKEVRRQGRKIINLLKK